MAGEVKRCAPGHRLPGHPARDLVRDRDRALIGAMFGSVADGELVWACKLLHVLDEPMLVLMDRGFDAGEFLADVAATKAQFLVRLTATRQPPVLRHLPNGSFTSLVDGGKGPDCRRIGHGRLPRQHPVRRSVSAGHHPARSSRLACPRADGLAPRALGTPDHLSYAAAHLLPGRVLRSDDPIGLEQEIWALPALYRQQQVPAGRRGTAG